jgi:plasmid stability protein
MASMTIRNLADETHRAIKARAKSNGRSAEAETRAILDEAVLPKDRIKVGTEIRKLVAKYGGFDLNIERDQTPARYPDFSGPEFDPPESK